MQQYKFINTINNSKIIIILSLFELFIYLDKLLNDSGAALTSLV